MHHTNVVGDYYGTKNLFSISNIDPIIKLPIKLEFDSSSLTKNSELIKSKISEKFNLSQSIFNYYSNDIYSLFQTSKLFEMNRESNIRIRVIPNV